MGEQAGLGETLAQAQAGAFFSWFCLTAVDDPAPAEDEGPGTARRTCRFRPSGPRFQHLVELAVRLDAEQRIREACLGIDRVFIGAAAIRPFARDIAKSFLQWILPDEASAAFQPEIDAIARFCDGESRVIAHPSAFRRSWREWWRPRDGGDAAEVFMGSAARSERRIGPTRIAFENLIEPLPHGVTASRPAARAVPGEGPASWLCITVVAAEAA